MEVTSWTTLPRMDVIPSLTETWTSLGLQRNGRATSRKTIGSIGPKFGIHCDQEKKWHSSGQFGTKWLMSTSGGPASLRYLFLNNVCFVSPIRVNQSNINYGIASKQVGNGDGQHSSCMSFAG